MPPDFLSLTRPQLKLATFVIRPPSIQQQRDSHFRRRDKINFYSALLFLRLLLQFYLVPTECFRY